MNIYELYALRLLTNYLKNILLAIFIINTKIVLSNCAKHVITIIFKNYKKKIILCQISYVYVLGYF